MVKTELLFFVEKNSVDHDYVLGILIIKVISRKRSTEIFDQHHSNSVSDYQ